MDEYGIAYQEVFQIVLQMEEKYLKMIPEDIWKQIQEKRDISHNLNCNLIDGIEYKDLNKKTWEILSFLNYNYWATEDKKKSLEKIYEKNESIIQTKKMEKYDINFMNKKETKI